MQPKNGNSHWLIIMFGVAVFSMHFGASCMLWPVTWGQQSGSSVLPAALGIMITAIIFPFLGYLAIVRGEGSFYTLASRINKKFAFVFGGLTVAVLGPLFVIPRMSAASWDAICKIGNWNSDQMVPALIFAIVYYLVTYWFLFRLEEVLTKIGKYLVPVLVITIVAVVAKSLMSPLSEWMPKLYEEGGFAYGFINGYQTMDLPAALIYGVIIIADLKANKMEGRALSKNLLIVGAIGFGFLAVSHFLQMLVGASTGYLFKDVTYAKLYATIILNLWGVFGGTVFNIALFLAALTSAVGLAAGTAAYFEEATEKKWSYKSVAVGTLVISALISSFGLTTIVKLTAPILSLVYPPCIALVLGYIIFGNKRYSVIGGATIVAFAWGCLDCLIGYLDLAKVDTASIKMFYDLVPGAKFGLAWIIPTALGAVAGYILKDKRDDLAQANVS
jgi:LIVCS family branched-chain amino acid:cation transporter